MQQQARNFILDLKEAKSCSPRPRTGQFSRTWRVRGQGQVQGLDSRGQGQGLQKLSSRPPPLILQFKMYR